MKLHFLCCLLIATTACIEGPEQHNRLCPCSAGWVCVEGRCVEEELVCPGICGDGVVCPDEECDDGDRNDCTYECNANCTGPAAPNSPTCVEPTIAFAEEALEVNEIPPTDERESETHLVYAHSSNAYHQDVTVNFGTSNDLNEGKLIVTPDTGQIVIRAGETVSEPIGLEVLRDAVTATAVRRVYVALLGANPGEVGAPAVFTLFVRNRVVPQVVRTVPASDATLVPVNTDIEIEFSRAMDAVLTAAAFAIDPEVEGTISWEQDDHLLVFSPADDLDEQQLYVVTLSSQAASAQGVRLGDHGFSFETFGSLDVALIMTVLSHLH